MKQSYTNEKTGIDYTFVGDVYLPNLVLPHNNSETLGIWGQRYLEHIKIHCKPFYTSLKMQCKLDEHLREVDMRASEMYDRLVNQLKEQQGITEKLKADDMMAWVGAMNSIANHARELVNSEVIYIV